MKKEWTKPEAHCIKYNVKDGWIKWINGCWTPCGVDYKPTPDDIIIFES